MKKGLIYALVVVSSLALTISVAKAAGMTADWLRVGTQASGGVTYFNGTIINETTGTGGANNPVTFGDNVRIDGRVYRGATAGTTDSQPFSINDNMEVAGSLTIGSLASSGIIATANIADSAITSAKITDGAIATADLASGAVTQGIEAALITSTNTTASGGNFDTLTSLSITTEASSLFCSWNGYGDTINDSELIRVQMLLDGVLATRTVRITRTSAGLTSAANMATQAIFTVAAGTHTVAVQWNTDTSANMYANTLDCIELKK